MARWLEMDPVKLGIPVKKVGHVVLTMYIWMESNCNPCCFKAVYRRAKPPTITWININNKCLNGQTWLKLWLETKIKAMWKVSWRWFDSSWNLEDHPYMMVGLGCFNKKFHNFLEISKKMNEIFDLGHNENWIEDCDVACLTM